MKLNNLIYKMLKSPAINCGAFLFIHSRPEISCHTNNLKNGNTRIIKEEA